MLVGVVVVISTSLRSPTLRLLKLVTVPALPLTFPVTLPTKSVAKSLFIVQRSLALTYVNVALAPSIVIPAPFAALAVAAPLANVKFKSSTLTTVLLIVVVVPSICKSPAITTLPVLSPTPAGSIVKVAGPAI